MHFFFLFQTLGPSQTTNCHEGKIGKTRQMGHARHSKVTSNEKARFPGSVLHTISHFSFSSFSPFVHVCVCVSEACDVTKEK
jgi:hypothetical protein